MTREELEGIRNRFQSVTMYEVFRLALIGLDAETIAATHADFHDALHAGEVDLPSYAKGFRRGQEDMREKAAKVAKVAWLTCEYGEIADADVMDAASQHAEAAIRSLPIEGETK